jgi:hypothetical protein
MRAASADGQHGTQYTGEDRTSADFAARLDVIADAGDTETFTWSRDGERNVGYAPILEHEMDQRTFIDFKRSLIIGKAGAEFDLFDGKFGEFETHDF